MTKWNAGKRIEGGSARRFAVPEPKGPRVNLAPDHPALVEGRSLFQARVIDASMAPRLLIGGHNAAKIGKDIRKGRWSGMPVYTLTLEERKTCPRSCQVWANCYGNNMHMARRIIAGKAMERKLWTELQSLNGIYPAGFVVRLHILGDFYSLDYVRHWDRALDAFSALRVFGYTAHDPDSEIGLELLGMTLDRWDRFSMRFSGADIPDLTTVVVDTAAEVPAGAILCPAQTGRTERCGTCALCWQSRRPVAFLRH